MNHKGKKTHGVAAGMVLFGVGGFLTGLVSPVEAAQLVLNGLGISALRLGIANPKGK